jgi:hypothetical protein
MFLKKLVFFNDFLKVNDKSGYISQRHVSADPKPDPHQNVMDPEHWLTRLLLTLII